MASITEKRLSLHRHLEIKNQENNELRSQLTHIQHLANIGTISHMIAHEINNLLTPLRSYATFALQNQNDKNLSEKALQKTAKNCEHASKIMQSLLALADGQKQEKENVKLISLVEDVFTCLCRDFSKDKIQIEINIPQDLSICIVPVQFQQVLMNLVINARHAMLPRGGKLTINALQKNGSLEIEVADTGDGIKPEHLQHIFDSFFTTKKNNKTPDSHSGTGLGLAFCKKIVEEHNGRITAESKPCSGTIFKIVLPEYQPDNC
ncbi:MAG: HAMP domain-containing histidine kinase [Sedimentisphaerales bacterium]|nr:HAMP domain-containing histidine kinase [Sedimentisphaerales bacterium]